jgi:hypothetical protein
MRKSASWLGTFVALVSLLSGQFLLADVTGTILGTVSDPTGATVPGASVTLTNPNTGITRKTTTDVTGSYQFLSVPAGANYVVTVEASGFKKASQSGILLLVNQNFRGDFKLPIGTVAESVNVSAQTVQVETTSTQVGDVIQDKKMANLPLNGRSYIDLLGLQVGVVPIPSGMENADRPVSGAGNAGNLSVNGEREAANAFLVNGGDVEEGRNNGASIVPVLDSIQEFRILTSSFDPEYGRFSGGIVNVVTKSGTNSFHGTVFEFLRNEKLDSRNFFEPNLVDPITGQYIPGSARGEFRRNQFGWAVGGPILKNRLFFFSDYQGSREVRGISTGAQPVPSAQERTGDFSDVGVTGFNPLTKTVQGDNLPGHFAQTLSSRLGYPVTAGEPYWVSGCTSAAQAQADVCVFPNQVIPQSAWDPVASKTLQFFPTAVATSGGVPFFATSAYKRIVNDDKFGVRVDLNHQTTGNWRFYYHFDNATLTDPYPNSFIPGFPARTPSRAQQANLGWTHTFSPTVVNDLTLNYTRSALTQDQPIAGLGNVSTFGFQRGGLGIVPAVPSFEGLPEITLALLNGASIGLPNSSTIQYNNTFQVGDGISFVKGRHTSKLGGEFRFFQINVRGEATEDGAFTFNGSETGNDFADYLIGAVPATNFNQGAEALGNERSKYGGLYAQDSFKFRPNLTVNYGLRWELSQPFYDTQNMLEAFVPGLQSVIFPAAPTGWVVPGDPGITKTIAPTRYDNFAPRAGIAYSPGFSDGVAGKLFGGPGKTSVRASAGIFSVSIEELGQFYEVGDSPFGLYFVNPSADYLSEPYKTRTTGPDIGQRFPFVRPVGHGPFPNFNWALAQPLSGSPGIKQDNVLPYSEHFDFSIQRQLGGGALLSVGYAGSRGHHLITQVSFNPGIASECLQIASLFSAIGQSGQGCGPFGEDTIYSFPGGAGQPAQTFYGTRIHSVTSGWQRGPILLMTLCR